MRYKVLKRRVALDRLARTDWDVMELALAIWVYHADTDPEMSYRPSPDAYRIHRQDFLKALHGSR